MRFKASRLALRPESRRFTYKITKTESGHLFRFVQYIISTLLKIPVCTGIILPLYFLSELVKSNSRYVISYSILHRILLLFEQSLLLESYCQQVQ